MPFFDSIIRSITDLGRSIIELDPKAAAKTAVVGGVNLFITAGTTYFFSENALEFLGISSTAVLTITTVSAVYMSGWTQSIPSNYRYFTKHDMINENNSVPITGCAKVAKITFQGVAGAMFGYLLFNNYTSAVSLLKIFRLDYEKYKVATGILAGTMAADKVFTIYAYVWNGVSESIDTAVVACFTSGSNGSAVTTRSRKAIAISIVTLGSISIGAIGGFITNNSLSLIGGTSKEIRTTLSIAASILYALLTVVSKGYDMGKNINSVGIEVKNKNKLIVTCHLISGGIQILYSGIATQAAATKVLAELFKINSKNALGQTLLAPVSVSGAALEYFYVVQKSFKNIPEKRVTRVDPTLLDGPQRSDQPMEEQSIEIGTIVEREARQNLSPNPN